MKNKKLSILAVFVITLIISTIVLMGFNNIAFDSGLCGCANGCGGGGLFIICDCWCIYFFGMIIPSNFSEAAVILTYFISYVLPLIIAIVSTIIFTKKFAKEINK